MLTPGLAPGLALELALPGLLGLTLGLGLLLLCWFRFLLLADLKLGWLRSIGFVYLLKLFVNVLSCFL